MKSFPGFFPILSILFILFSALLKAEPEDLSKHRFRLKSKIVQIRIPTGASGRQIHLILELKDNNPIAPLFDYRRIVIDVN